MQDMKANTIDSKCGSLVYLNEVAPCQAKLVLGWVTVSGFNSWCGKFVLIYPATQLISAWPFLNPWIGTMSTTHPRGQ